MINFIMTVFIFTVFGACVHMLVRANRILKRLDLETARMQAWNDAIERGDL